MVTKDKKWWIFEVLSLSTNYNGHKPSKYDFNFKFPIITHYINDCQGQPMVTKDKQWCTFEVSSLSTNYNEYNCWKYALNFKFPIITHYINGC